MLEENLLLQTINGFRNRNTRVIISGGISDSGGQNSGGEISVGARRPTRGRGVGLQRHAAEDLCTASARRISGTCHPRACSSGNEATGQSVGTMAPKHGTSAGSTSSRPELTGLGN